MIEKISIKNYQSLSDIEIIPGKFTAIIGESGCGKSAFIRAMEGVTINAPVCGSDWSYLPYGSNKAHVSISLDGHSVAWIKGKSTNNYAVDGELLKNVGRGCPEEVFKFLKMGEIAVDGSKYHMNIDRQFDIPFLCDSNGTLVAKVLGELTNVNLLMAATREANKEKLNKSKLKGVREKDLIELKGELENYSQLGGKKTYLELLKSLGACVELDIKKYKDLESLEENIKIYQNKVIDSNIIVDKFENALKSLDTQDLNDKLFAFNEFDDIKGRLEEIKGKMDKAYCEVALYNSIEDVNMNGDVIEYNDMVTYVERFEEVGSWIKYNTYQVSNLAFLEEYKLPSVSDYLEMEGDCLELWKAQNNMMISTNKLNKAEADLKDYKAHYELFVSKNPLCPVCKKPLDKEM